MRHLYGLLCGLIHLLDLPSLDIFKNPERRTVIYERDTPDPHAPPRPPLLRMLIISGNKEGTEEEQRVILSIHTIYIHTLCMVYCE